MAPWVSRYVGIPYRFGGATRSGADCWGLVRLVMACEFGIDLPRFDHDEASPDRLAAIVGEAIPLLAAEKVEIPRVGDLALLRIFGRPCHVGLVIGEPNERNLLHTLGQHDSALDYHNGSRWLPRLEGYYRVA